MSLKYNIYFWNGQRVADAGPYIQFRLNNNWSGVPYARIYLEGGAVPAFTAMPVLAPSYSYKVQPLIAGTYIIDYQDDNGEIRIGKINIYDFADSCQKDDDGDGYQENGTNGLISVQDGGVLIQWNMSNSGDDGTHNRNRKVSIDGGVSFKTIIGDSFSNVQWSNSELAALGVDDELPTITVERVGEVPACVTTPGVSIRINGIVYDPLDADYDSTDCTSAGADDGTITVTPTGGSGNYDYLWNDGMVSQNRSALAPGEYSVTVSDTVTLESVEITGIIIRDPEPGASLEGSLLEIPIMNSLHFVVDPIVADNISTFQTPDNTLFSDQVFPRMQSGRYYQKVCNADEPIVQFNSDFPNHTVELYNCDDELIKSFGTVLSEENIGQSEDYTITIKNHTDNPGKSRIYFNVGEIPIPLAVGDVFEILNNLDGFDGSYSVVAIEEDALLGYQYLVITRNYDIAASSSSATGRFITSTEDFNVYESTLSLTDVEEGVYYVKVRAFNELTESIGISEPIHIKESHENTCLLTYRNNDNAFNMTWTTGYIGRIRVESQLFKRSPGGERSMSRDSDFSLQKVSAKKIRGFTFETYLLPPYLHEKLSVLFDCDFFSINGVEFQTAEGYNEPTYIEYFPLANSSIKVEQVGWMDRYNTHDIGTVNDGGFLITEQGYLKL